MSFVIINKKKEKKEQKKVENKKENKEKSSPKKKLTLFSIYKLLVPSTGVVQVSMFAHTIITCMLMFLYSFYIYQKKISSCKPRDLFETTVSIAYTEFVCSQSRYTQLIPHKHKLNFYYSTSFFNLVNKSFIHGEHFDGSTQ